MVSGCVALNTSIRQLEVWVQGIVQYAISDEIPGTVPGTPRRDAKGKAPHNIFCVMSNERDFGV